VPVSETPTAKQLTGPVQDTPSKMSVFVWLRFGLGMIDQV